MKYIKIVSIISVMFLILGGCAIYERMNEFSAFNAYNESEPILAVSAAPDMLVFSSLEEFLSIYRAVEGNAIRGEASVLAESINLMSLARFYMPSQIPPSYQLYKLDICERVIGMWFLPEQYLVSEESILYATARQRHFLFSQTRTLNLESPMDGTLRRHGLSESDFFDKIGASFDVEAASDIVKPAAKHEFGLYMKGPVGCQWHRLRAKQGKWNDSDPVERLDVSILQKHLLEPILGIDDPRTNKRIDFVGGIRALVNWKGA